MGMEESQKALNGDLGGTEDPQWGPGAMPWWGSGGEVLWSWRLSLNPRYEKPHFLALGPVSNSHSQTTLFFALKGFLPQEQTRFRQRSISKDYSPDINNNGCTLNHLSFWLYVLIYMGRSSCQQLTNDSTQNRKASLVIVIAPGNKTSKVSNEWHWSMFGNKLMTALVTLKRMADQQSAWGSSLKVILAVVVYETHWEQSWLQCTAKYTNAGGSRQYTTQSWRPLLARWTVTDCISTVTVCMGTITGHSSTQTTVHLSQSIDLYQRLCNCRHILSFLWLFLTKILQPIQFQQFSPN